MNKELIIKNCRLYKDLNKTVDILIENGKIKQIGEKLNSVGEEIDAGNLIAAPGLIDLHIQGAGGFDILDNSEEAVLGMSKTLASLGTTGFLATTVVKPNWGNSHLISVKKLTGKAINGATILGSHLEGPFININKKGGIDAKSIYPSSPEGLKEIFDITGNSLKMMTIAPELEGNDKIIEELVKLGVVASFAHSEADYFQTKEGINNGISHVTHICNAMRPIHHREPGPIPAIIDDGNLSCQIISDGHHIHGGMIKLLYKSLGINNCVCITDGIQAMGLPEGKYVYNGREYFSKDGAAKYDDGTLIGSALSLLKIVGKFIEFTGCTLEDGINSASMNPAKVLKIEGEKGILDVGKDADIILFDEQFNNRCTIINGNVIFREFVK